MAMRYLGATLDVHAGGLDLLFPHHENEIAQAEAATGRPFARTWLHSGFVTDETGAKMSKSSGRFATLRDLLAAGHDPVAVRLFLLGTAHYRAPVALNEGALHAAAEQVRRLRDLARRLREEPSALGADDAGVYQDVVDAREAYREALDDDLNLPAGLGRVFEVVREVNGALDEGRLGSAGRQAMAELLAEADRHLDVLREEELALGAEVEQLVAEREVARRSRDFALADSVRDRLKEQGVTVEDTPSGPRARLARR
jgi:cysteinyl-tRNA synthetase